MLYFDSSENLHYIFGRFRFYVPMYVFSLLTVLSQSLGIKRKQIIKKGRYASNKIHKSISHYFICKKLLLINFTIYYLHGLQVIVTNSPSNYIKGMIVLTYNNK